jgi:phospholipase C
MKTSIYLFITIAAIGLLTSCSQKPEVPRPDHVIVVIEENHGYDELIGSADAPFINQLANAGALFTDAHGVTHPSQPNYLAIFSGSIQGVTDDKCLQNETPYTTPNLAASLIDKGFTFKGYAQTMPSAGFLECEYLKSPITGASLYARKHAPWVNWQGTQTNNIPASLSLPMTSFPKDFSKLPTVAFVIPDMDNDMHNIGAPGDKATIQRGDQWLKENLSAYVEWAKTHNSLLIVTFDEDDFKPVNHIPTFFVGAQVKPGQYSEKINHYSVLHTIEAMYDLPVADTTNADVITGVWK